MPGLPGNLSLSEVRGAQAELEFWMPLDAVDTQALDRLLAQHILPGHARPPLRPQAVEGLLMGFADLVFEHEGRYEVLDYKSNRLGLNASGYTLDSMRRAVLEHRYDVQAALYLLALHRMLKQRLGSAYNPRLTSISCVAWTSPTVRRCLPSPPRCRGWIRWIA